MKKAYAGKKKIWYAAIDRLKTIMLYLKKQYL